MATAVGCTCAESAQLVVSSCVLFRHSLTGHNTQMQLNLGDREAEFTWRVQKKVQREQTAYISVTDHEVLHLATTPKVLHNHS